MKSFTLSTEVPPEGGGGGRWKGRILALCRGIVKTFSAGLTFKSCCFMCLSEWD